MAGKYFANCLTMQEEYETDVTKMLLCILLQRLSMHAPSYFATCTLVSEMRVR